MAISSWDAENERYKHVLPRIQELWQNYSMCSNIEMILTDCFSSAENPYAAALHLMAYNDSFRQSKKNSLSAFVMRTFENWLVNNENISKLFLTKDIKLETFRIVNEQKNTNLTKKVIEIFQMKSDKEMFLPYILDLISSQKFKQACQSAALLELHSHFVIHEFLIPLILQDKLVVVEEFISESPEHQREIAVFLDELLGKENLAEEMQHLTDELKVVDAKVHKFNHKCLNKLIGRYMKDFKIPSEVCPCYMEQQKKKALSFVVWKKYIDKTLEGESWKEMMLEIVKDTPKMQYELVDMLVDYCDIDEAFHWCKHFELDKDKLPRSLKCMFEESVVETVLEEENWDDYEAESRDKSSFPPFVPFTDIPEIKPVKHKKIASTHYYNSYVSHDDWDMETSTGCASYSVPETHPVEDELEYQPVSSFHKTEYEDDEVEDKLYKGEQFEEVVKNASNKSLEYHVLPLSEDNIIVVDTSNSLLELIEVGLEGVEIVGLDCEWKPSFYYQKSKVALLQLAMWSRIYLIDVLSLADIPSRIWSDFNKMLFENEEIIKLGFDIHADKSMLLETVPYLRGFGSVSFLDLASIWKLLVNKYSFTFPIQDDNSQSGQSLAQLVSLCFGKCLDKSDQFSNWEKRPLRKSQQIYAALDAYCLLEIYDCLKNSCKSQGIPFDEVIALALKCSKPSNTKTSKGKKLKKKVNPNFSPNETPVEPEKSYPPAFPQSFKMVCDVMVQGLGRKLRSCGINTWILQNNDSSDTCVKVALRDNRIILTRGGNYYKFIKYVNRDQCYQVKSDVLDDQVKEVLNFFHITLRKEDIFSRCQVCNGDSFAEIQNSKMKQIMALSGDEGMQSFGGMFHVDQTDGAAAVGEYSDFGKKWVKGNSIRELKEVTDKTFKGVKIKCHHVSATLLSRVEYFYACDKCGKVYWDGGHWQRELYKKREANLLK